MIICHYDKEGSRCDSGAVPAAVILTKNIRQILATVRSGWEGRWDEGKPENLPQFQTSMLRVESRGWTNDKLRAQIYLS